VLAEKVLDSGPYYPLGSVPRAYERMEGRKNKIKEIKK
jgi:hypothetical protein